MRKYIQTYTSKYFSFFAIFYIFFTVVFSRTASGFYVLGFRLGEIAVGLSILFFILSITIFKYEYKYSQLKISLFFLATTFLISNIYYKSSVPDLYVFRTSSYIWFLSFLLVGIHSKKIDLKENYDKYFYILLLYIYISGILGAENNLLQIFSNFSDKIELHKGSEIVLIFICFFFLKNNFRKRTINSYLIFIFFISAYGPFLMYKSRAAFIVLIFYIIFEIYYFIRILKFNKNIFLSTLLIVLIIGTFSTILSQNALVPEFENFPELIKSSYSNIISERYKLYDTELPFVYFDNGRMFTADGNLNWRIQMWQDMFSYIGQSINYILFGIGFGEMLPVFDVSLFDDAVFRLGLDGLNEHLHNFFLTVFARGGLLHLLLVASIFVFVYSEYSRIHKDRKILIVLICVFFVSFFDSSMENAHFPAIFYFFLGNQLINKSKL